MVHLETGPTFFQFLEFYHATVSFFRLQYDFFFSPLQLQYLSDPSVPQM